MSKPRWADMADDDTLPEPPDYGQWEKEKTPCVSKKYDVRSVLRAVHQDGSVPRVMPVLPVQSVRAMHRTVPSRDDGGPPLHVVPSALEPSDPVRKIHEQIRMQDAQVPSRRPPLRARTKHDARDPAICRNREGDSWNRKTKE